MSQSGEKKIRKQQFQNIAEVLQYARALESKLEMLVELMTFKNVLKKEDFSEYFQLLETKPERKQLKIKELMTFCDDNTMALALEKLIKEVCLAENSFDQFNINPQRDLGWNPQEIVFALKEISPNKWEEWAKLWQLDKGTK